MKLVSRSASVVTGREDLEVLLRLPDFPVFFGTVDTGVEQDLHADMEWAIDRETGVVQLTKLIPLEVLYAEQHVDGCGATWARYYAEFARYVAASGARSVLEIGGGAGALAHVALQQNHELDWTIIEPNPTVAPAERLSVIEGFFDRTLVPSKQFDTVVFSQVMEHVYEPRSFLADIAAFLKPGGRLVFAYPNLEVWLRRKYTNALNFEHTMLLTDRHLDSLLPEYGFKVEHKDSYLEHSFFYSAVREAGPLPVPQMPNLYKEYRELFMDFVQYHRDTVAHLNNLMEASDEEFYLFGAHIFSTFLFAFGLNPKRIAGILDNSPTKEGRRLYGTRFIVKRPSVLRGKTDVAVILRAAHFNEEIKAGILNEYNANVRFV